MGDLGQPEHRNTFASLLCFEAKWSCKYQTECLLLKYVIDANTAEALTLSISTVSLKLAMLAMAVTY